MKDKYGRELGYLRLSVTETCNLRCQYCIPNGQQYTQHHKNSLTLEEMYKLVKIFVDIGVYKVRITGGEPLLRKGVLSLAEKIAALEGVQDLSMTTNGLLLKQYAKAMKEAGIQRVNISLDSLDAIRYASITGGGNLQTVLNGIEEAKKVGLFPIKLNTVLIKGFNDDEIVSFVQKTKQEDVEIRFIELMPIGHGINWSKEKFLSAQAVLKAVPALKPLTITDCSSTTVYYRLPNAKGKVGLIRPISCKFCSQCNRVRLTSDGRLKYCLHSNIELDIKKAFREGTDIQALIAAGAMLKPQSHTLEEQIYMHTNMFQIGG